MNRCLPFYMVYDTDIWNDENLSRRDYDYMKSAYPDMAKYVMPFVEEECDRLEFSGSMMFDECPDQLQMRMLCRRIHEKIKKDTIMEMRIGNETGNWLMELIQVLTWHEILRRRAEYRKYKRKIY